MEAEAGLEVKGLATLGSAVTDSAMMELGEEGGGQGETGMGGQDSVGRGLAAISLAVDSVEGALG